MKIMATNDYCIGNSHCIALTIALAMTCLYILALNLRKIIIVSIIISLFYVHCIIYLKCAFQGVKV